MKEKKIYSIPPPHLPILARITFLENTVNIEFEKNQLGNL
jgi:hypothetical protein